MSVYVGSRFVTINDPIKNVSFPCHVWYPTEIPSVEVNLEPYSFSLSLNSPIKPGQYPLILLSHGSGGSYLAYRDLASFLVKNGFIVAMPEHYGNNRNDNNLSGARENLVLRPRHIKLSIDTVLNSKSDLKANLDYNRIGFIGHSMGAYTGLAITGGQPYWSPKEPVQVDFDDRIKSAVLLAPATAWFVANGSLDRIKISLQVWVSEDDTMTPPWQGQLILDQIKEKKLIDYHFVKYGTHFSYLSSFPDSLSHLPQAQDPNKLSRIEFQKVLFPGILKFLTDTLISA